jgi:amidase
MTDPHDESFALAYLTSDEIVSRLGDGSLTSSGLVATLIERISALDGAGTPVQLNAMMAIAAEARSVAAERDQERSRGVSRGPLHGLPVVIKDNIEAMGLPGAAGSTALIGRPTRDAALVTSMRDAGAVILGSTNLSQWANIRSARSTSGYSATSGLVGNPWALDRSAGGSSSGAGAALAAGFAPLAVGTETDGSIVCPASLNGVVGLKPTVGDVSARHVVPISASQDSPGPMGRTVGDVARLFTVLSGRHAPRLQPALRIGVAVNWRSSHPATDQLFDEVVADMHASGLRVGERELAVPGEAEGNDELVVLLSELSDDLSAYLKDRPGAGVASLADVIAYEDQFRDVEQAFFGHDFFLKAVDTGGRAGAEYAGSRERNLRWAIDTCLTPGLDGFDVVVAPSYGPAWKSDLAVGGHPGPASVATMAPAIAGWPIMSVPIGLVQGLPVGMAIIGRPHDEWTMLAVARQIEDIVALRGALPRPFWKPPVRG